MKKTLLVLMTVFAFAVFVGCKSEKYPQISESNELYFSAKEGEYTYTLTNGEAYEEMKTKVGLNLLLDTIDRDLLQFVKRNGKSYWDSVTEEEITEKIEEEIFPSGTDNLTADEIEKAREEFFDKMFIQYGFNTEDEVRDYYRLTLAKRLYASDRIFEPEEEEGEEAGEKKDDFSEEEYQNYYKNNYKKGYYALIVAYETPKLVQQALESLNVRIDRGIWSWIDGNQLSEWEIVETLIALYNSANSHKLDNYPEATLILNEDTEYTISGDKINFVLENIKDELFYTHNEIYSYDSVLQKQLQDNLESYGEGSNFYLRNPLSNATGSRHYLMMKIAEEDVPAFEDVKEEIKEKLISGRLSSTFISKKIAQLRREHNLVIYDDFLEERYSEQAKGLDVEYKETKKLNGNLVAKTDVSEYSADELFEIMSEGYGLTLAASKIEYLRLLYNPKYNDIYSMDKSLKESERIIKGKEDEYQAIKNEIEDEKAAFEAGEYKDYGYPAKMGWKNFIKVRYGVATEEDVFYLLLFNRVKDNYAKSLGKITAADSELADFYLRQMQKQVDDYFKARGIQLVIEVLDEKGKAKDPEKWNATQNEYAKHFYKDVLDLLAAELKENETYEKRLHELVTAYKKAPRFLAGLPQDKDSQPSDASQYLYEGIEISKYKTAGLNIRFSDLGTFTNGSKAKALNDAAKEIWDKDPDSKETVIYGLGEEEIPYIITSEGFHVYINLETMPLSEWETGKVLPTIEQIMTYEKSSSDSSLTTKIKTAITTYYKPIHDELTGSYNVAATLYEGLKTLEVEFGHDHFTATDFTRYLDLQIASNRERLKYTD